jgi:DNA mismatch repair protein MutS2
MDQKTLATLEYPKVLERLAAHCAFLPSAELARGLLPVTDIELARQMQAETSEATTLLDHSPDLTIGAARDVRYSIDLAKHGGVLTAMELLDLKSTLLASRTLLAYFNRLRDAYPNLSRIATQMTPPAGLVEAINHTISDRGDILDSASEQLYTIRHDMRIAHERLLTKLQRMLTDPKNAPYLQEALVTQRDGRYVLPLRAEFKGRIKSIVHDQSSSGATLFVEPLAVVELNNQYRELQLAERDEERRILAHLSQAIGSYAAEILEMVDTIARLDLVFARAKYAKDLSAIEPGLLHFQATGKTHHPGSAIRLYGARHPLLDPGKVVPIDVELDAQTYALIITGPNTGGKTVTLKTIGLLALMAQSGLHIPAQTGSEITLFQDIFADIGDEQSIEQSLSTFSGHVTNIIRILEHADRRSLVILDELGAGTDPQEGAALARALLSHLLERSITTLVTTHHPELKAYAHAAPGAMNASMEFDLETLQPTYRLNIGLPGRSNAIAIAQRLGMPDAIIQTSRSELNPSDLHAEDLLDEIVRQRELSRQARTDAEKAFHEAEAQRAALADRLDKIEDERRKMLDKTRIQAESQLAELEEEIRQLRKSLARARQPLEAVESVQERLDTLQEDISQPIERHYPPSLGRPVPRAIRLGDKVVLRSLNTQGVVTSLGEEEAEVQVGVLRVRARLADLHVASSQSDSSSKEPIGKTQGRRKVVEQPSAEQATRHTFPASPGMELDLRGQRADDALAALDRYLDTAYLAGLPWVRIIHGKGTGKLRQAVRDTLRQHPHVKGFEAGAENEGGDGVTIVKFQPN